MKTKKISRANKKKKSADHQMVAICEANAAGIDIGAQAICALRSLYRHRQNLLQFGAQHIQHMQAAMEQMNLKLAHVIDDITGLTGMRIIEAILSGERDREQLAKLRDRRVKASQATVA